MSLRRLRHAAWVLVLVLATGLASPVFATNAPHPLVQDPAATVHTHADGTSHSHAVVAGEDAANPLATGQTQRSYPCPGCLTGAACAMSCLGVALLPVSLGWEPPAVRQSWAMLALSVPDGVGPPGDLNPPRPVFVR